MSTRSVLIEYEDPVGSKLYASSACSIAEKYVITTSNILITEILKSTDFEKKLQTQPPGFSPWDSSWKCIPEINIVLNNDPYLSKSAKIFAVYISDRIRKQITTYFNDWTIDDENQGKQIKEILSLFFIFAFNDDLASIDDFLKCLSRNSTQSGNNSLKIGDKIVIEGTPFGNRNFLRSQSRGIVSNIFGVDNCFILTDTPTAPGCEGSPIYLKTKKKEIVPVGVVLASMSWWKGEWIGLTLGATFPGIFSELTQKSNFPIARIKNINQIHDVVRSSLVQVVSGTSWGSAILLDKENGIFITNSHVLEPSSPILIWQDVEIKAMVIYQSREDEIYDLAVLMADLGDLKKANMLAVKVSTDEISIGETVYAAGFPLFPRQTKPEPTLTKGQISQITRAMIKTTCSVLPGSSGGAILKKDGTVIGIITGNTRMYENMAAFPRVNMAIPVHNILHVLRDYLRTKDARMLQRLKVDDLFIRNEWNFYNPKL